MLRFEIAFDKMPKNTTPFFIPKLNHWLVGVENSKRLCYCFLIINELVTKNFWSAFNSLSNFLTDRSESSKIVSKVFHPYSLLILMVIEIYNPLIDFNPNS